MNKALLFSGIAVLLAQQSLAQGIAGDAENGQLRSAIAVHTSEMRVCYRDNQKSLKGAQGKVFYEFEVNDKGELIKVEFSPKKSAFKNEVLNSCILEKAKTWTYPAAPAGKTVKVLFPFTFKPSKD
jgi:hypothetical protein